MVARSMDIDHATIVTTMVAEIAMDMGVTMVADLKVVVM
jgi:hypothetical protein